MTEALQLGVDVIATAYGGNTSFCIGPFAHPVRCQEVTIPAQPIPAPTATGGANRIWSMPPS